MTTEINLNDTIVEEACDEPDIFLQIPYRSVAYIFFLTYCLSGLLIIHDAVLSGAHYIITATKEQPSNSSSNVEEVKVWEDHIANLTVVPIACNLPIILFSVIQLYITIDYVGNLGPSVVYGSAAYQILFIPALCSIYISTSHSQTFYKIKTYIISSVFATVGYIWLLIIILASSANVVTIWEVAILFILYPLHVVAIHFIEKTKPLPESKYSLKQYLRQIQPKFKELSDEELAKLVAKKALTEAPLSALWYRIDGIRSLTGGKRLYAKLTRKLDRIYEYLQGVRESYEMDSKEATVEFLTSTCTILFTEGELEIFVVRKGNMKVSFSCTVDTIDGTALANQDYEPISETVKFESKDDKKSVTVYLADSPSKSGLTFFARLHIDPSDSNKVKMDKINTTIILISKKSKPGVLECKNEVILVKESVFLIYIPVIRMEGADGEVSVSWYAADGTAKRGLDYSPSEGSITFQHGEIEKNIEIELAEETVNKGTKQFEIHIEKPRGGVILGDFLSTKITVVDDSSFNTQVNYIIARAQLYVDMWTIRYGSWSSQFTEIIFPSAGQEFDTSQLIIHYFNFPWKLIVAFVPPPAVGSGWLRFLVASFIMSWIIFIACRFSCIATHLLGLPETLTSLTYLAMAFSIPDTAAARLITQLEKNCDISLGQTMTNIGVTLYFAIGLNWLVAVCILSLTDTILYALIDPIAFAIAAFIFFFTLAIFLLALKKGFSDFEIGGPLLMSLIFSCLLIILWLFFVALSSYHSIHVVV